jgi:hypothetical protein
MERVMPRHPVEQIIDEFHKQEGETGWHLSVGAQNVIREVFLGLQTDDIGLVGLQEFAKRQEATATALVELPRFLNELAQQARAIPADRRSGDGKVIGAIYVTQNIGIWARVCPCWQREP